MSLYYETATILENKSHTDGSLKSRIYSNKELKSSPVSVYALASNATRWAEILKEVIDRSGLLGVERKLTPHLALLLSHDLLIAKNGVAAPKNHVLNLAISRHKARLSAEFARVRLRRGFSTIQELKESLSQCPVATEKDSNGPDKNIFQEAGILKYPRWIRINTLKTTTDGQLSTTFESLPRVESNQEVLRKENGVDGSLCIDTHIPNLISISPDIDYTRHPAYRSGHLIFQDKASCFSAYLLEPRLSDGDLIDACAAPGNKTTHLAALLQELSHNNRSNNTPQNHPHHRIIACERDADRAATLSQMVRRAGADPFVEVLNTDFLKLNPSDPRFANVTALLLDPSCSGSGMHDRSDPQNEEEGSALPLPSRDALLPLSTTATTKGKKRKRNKGRKAAHTNPEEPLPTPPTTNTVQSDGGAPTPGGLTEKESQEAPLQKRLHALSTFQIRLLTHAFRFPTAQRITYSTCSVYVEENEGVIVRALASDVARERGWRVLRREEQVAGLRGWQRRGIEGEFVEMKEEVRQACLRCKRGTDEGTMGFFVCGFVREGLGGAGREGQEGMGEAEGDEEEEEWEGFS
ncbi:MAG: hypothetical protein Q9157_008609 [Trypethelium eluteriae]